jgi:tRNA(Ile)-lysidine synthase
VDSEEQLPQDNDNILRAIERYPMFCAGDLALVAVSGGPDSVAMLHALHSLSGKLDISLHIAHLNHGIRGDESNYDEDYVCNLAHSYNIPITVERADVPAIKADLNLGEEEAARLVRYKFLHNTATELNAHKIAVGHNANDRAESVLLNIIRGCGLEGLASIKPINGKIVRPLIDTTRDEIERYVAIHALPCRIDSTNFDTAYARNRIRHELIPILQRDYNPQIINALLRLAQIAVDQTDVMNAAAKSADNAIRYDGDIDAALLADLPDGLISHILRGEIERIKGDLIDISFENINNVLEGLKNGCDFTINLPPGDIYVTRAGNSLKVWQAQMPVHIEPFECAIAIPGKTPIAAAGVVLDCSLIENPKPAKLQPNEVIIDIDAVAGELKARSVRPGDRISPMGMTGSKKLQDVFVDKKIPRRRRATAVVVCDDEKILWVVGIVASELGKVSVQSRKGIRITSDLDLLK